MSETRCITGRMGLSALIGISAIVGLSIPAFYEWTESDQSRPSPLLWQVPLWSAVISAAFCVALPWLPFSIKWPVGDSQSPVRFSVLNLLMITAGVAVSLSLLAVIPMVVTGCVFAGSFAYFVVFCVRSPQHRFAASSLIACMILPYVWLVGYDELDRILPTFVIMLAGMPAFVPAAMLSQLFEQNFRETQWLMFLATALEFSIGIWMISLGPKRTIAYLLAVLHTSTLGSLGFYMMCIA